jgi:hypothetical protein
MDSEFTDWMLDNEADAVAAARCFVAIAPCVRMFAKALLYPGNDICLHDISQSWSFNTLSFKNAPTRNSTRGMYNFLVGLCNYKFSPKILDIKNIKTLEELLRKKLVKRLMCYGDGDLIFDDGTGGNVVVFQQCSIVDLIITQKLQEHVSDVSSNVMPIGPVGFIDVQSQLMVDTYRPTRICIDPYRTWIEKPGDKSIPSVRFDLFGKQLLPIKEVVIATATSYLVDADRFMYSVHITRENNWLKTKQMFNVYHYY